MWNYNGALNYQGLAGLREKSQVGGGWPVDRRVWEMPLPVPVPSIFPSP